MVYEEIKDDLESFLKFYKLATAEGMDVDQIVNLLKIANNNLPAIEERFKRVRNDVSMLQTQKHTCKGNLYQLNNQIASTTKLLNSLRISCERERREIENLCNEKARLEATLTEFKNNNEGYLKIKQEVEENVKSVLRNGKLFLRFATASVIESLRVKPGLSNFIVSDNSNNTTPTYGSNHPSLISEECQLFSLINDDAYTALILGEAEKLYNKLTTKLTNSVISAATAVRASLPLPVTNNRQNDRYKIEEP